MGIQPPSMYYRAALTSIRRPQCQRLLHTSRRLRDSNQPSRASSLQNILASGDAPPVQVSSLTSAKGIQLGNGMLIPGACIFLHGQVLLWDAPRIEGRNWEGWTNEQFEVFDCVVPKPEILLFGTGRTIKMVPPRIKEYFSKLGIQLDVQDTRNACATYNLLSEEGRQVSAALLPLEQYTWNKQ